MSVRFDFLVSPVEILEGDDGRVRGVRLERNEIVDGRAKGTGQFEELECELVFRSIGYAGVPLAGIPFDERRGLIRNEGGRVVDEAGRSASASTSPAGSSAAVGVIGTNETGSCSCATCTATPTPTELELPESDPKPTKPASAGEQRKRSVNDTRTVVPSRSERKATDVARARSCSTPSTRSCRQFLSGESRARREWSKRSAPFVCVVSSAIVVTPDARTPRPLSRLRPRASRRA